jgi:hypothetical protein
MGKHGSESRIGVEVGEVVDPLGGCPGRDRRVYHRHNYHLRRFPQNVFQDFIVEAPLVSDAFSGIASGDDSRDVGRQFGII